MIYEAHIYDGIPGDIDLILNAEADDWGDAGELVRKWPTSKTDQGYRLWWPKRRWYHRLFRVAPKMKFEWTNPSLPEGEPVWFRLSFGNTDPRGESDQ